MNDVIKPGIYRHFKGADYELIDVAFHSETERPHVVYRPLYGEARLWLRPLELFIDHKEVDGIQVPRFERIGETAPVESAAQRKVQTFCQQFALGAPTVARLLDLCAELGELAKEWLKDTQYGKQPLGQAPTENWQAELGDVLFSLLCLANESGVDAEQALDHALERYRQRIEKAGHPGSEGAA